MVEMTYGNFEPINELERRTKAGGMQTEAV